ncbi:unnamed protein product [Diamesa serratosioi]
MYLNFLDYCNNTTIHGFKYIGDQKRHITEKIFWGIALVFSSIGCGVLIFELLTKLQNNPTVEYISASSTLVSEIPFPSVTFCPEVITKVGNFNYEIIVNKLMKNEIDFKNLTETELKLMQAIGLVMDDDILIYYLNDYNITIPTDDLMDYILILNRFIRWEMSASFAKKYSINFAKIITPWGYCSTFNILDAKDLLNLNNTSELFNYERSNVVSKYFHDFDYKSVESNASYPWKTKSSQLGLSITLKTMNMIHLVVNDLLKVFSHSENVHFGVHLIFHSTNELITKLPSNQRNFFGRTGGTTLFLVNPQITEIDDSLKSISPDDRKCYLNHEKTLKFFKVYSKNSCNQECISDQMLLACGCVQFHMIRSNETQVCGILDKTCASKVESLFSKKIENHCKCFPACHNIKYKIQLQNQKIIAKNLTNPTLFIDTEYIVKFKENEVFSLIRRKEFSGVQVLSFVGGLLGLFSGFSALSLVEVIYYFFIRIGFNILNMRNKVHPKVSSKFKNNNVRIIKDIANEYLAASTIHGLKADGSKHWNSKIFWMISFCISMIACGFMIQELYIKFQYYPIVITMNSESNDVQSIPFPSVTFCPEVITKVGNFNYEIIVNKLMKNEIDFKNLTETELKLMQAIGLVMDDDILINYLNDYNITIPTDDLMDYILILNRFIRWEMSASFAKKYSINFAKIITPWGYCSTFNILDAKDLLNLNNTSELFNYARSNVVFQYFHDFDYKSVESNASYPWKTKSSQLGLSITLQKMNFVNLVFHDLLKVFSHPENVHFGVHLIFHSTDELITKLPSNQRNFFGRTGGTTLFLVNPQITEIDNSLKSISPDETVASSTICHGSVFENRIITEENSYSMINAIKTNRLINLTPTMGKWNKQYNTPFADMFTRRGFGYTFNMINSSDLLYADE